MTTQSLSSSRTQAEKRRHFLPGLVPGLALSAAVSMASSLTPVAASAPRSAPAYVNTQFVTETRAEESGRLLIRNTSIRPRTLYARFQMPGDPENRNYGFVRTVPPLSSIAYDLPLGVRVFACDGKYWDDYRPDEAFAVTISKAQTYRFTHNQFKPTALRRAQGE